MFLSLLYRIGIFVADVFHQFLPISEFSGYHCKMNFHIFVYKSNVLQFLEG